MKQGIFQITENVALTDSVMRMRLEGDVSDITASGQFINVHTDYVTVTIRVEEIALAEAN